MLERFHIAEWYGKPFDQLLPEERVILAAQKGGSHRMKKTEVLRLAALEERFASGTIKAKELIRLEELRGKLESQRTHELLCPFKTHVEHPTCTKRGGVCSLRLYSDETGVTAPVTGKRGAIRALCPHRFHQDSIVFKHIGLRLLGDTAPIQVREVGFLESTGSLDSDPGEDVGRIDMILVANPTTDQAEMKWCAVEVQAVYFSGNEMSIEFRDIIENGGILAMPTERRRPDYRSSGPKRLMPQLQVKVPTLRRWGKKMALVIDEAFFRSMGTMRKVDHLSNCDVVWFLVDFVKDEATGIYRIVINEEFGTTLESAIEGLTGGEAVSREAFEDRIRKKFPR